ncbi:biotin/lipoyl-containing protein [Persicobacter psychrovividus]|uniref:Pyruvate carboxylase subunit B n=1 Tax=Persicobacter psychrovividus TaxID=387638 RepID=A0ABM7VGQ3_9BACT|nr:pyruvate carboxylase subunit B [Persicobacter psychrovividus]
MSKSIKFSLVYRDMWQSSGKYVPRVDQLTKVAPHIVAMGCFARVETNGGGFEQVNLLFGENPNKAVREWTQPFNDAGIQTHMLERALNGIRMSPVPADVRELFFKVKKAQGTDISRSFCGLNDPRNLENSIKFAKQAGMISQATLSVTYSPVHTVEYYVNLAKTLIEMGADEICVKDMAGIGRPVWLGKIVRGIKAIKPEIIIQYHAHSGPGFAPASILEVCRAGADIIDVGMEPLSWGTGHVDLLTAHEMLRDAGFEVPEINMSAYMQVRKLTQEFVDDFLGYYINPKNRYMNSLLIGPGLPGGMMGSLMADLEDNLKSINKFKTKKGLPLLTQDELLIKLFDEVQYVWPKLGYPPLVTPFSQYVKNVAMFNVMAMEREKARWSMIPDNVWDMILGKSGHLPGPVDEEVIALATQQNRSFFTGNPQDEYPDALPEFRAEMQEKGWGPGQDEEELFELAMHPEQYRAYKSGQAKADFLTDLNKRKMEREAKKSTATATPQPIVPTPSEMTINVNGEDFRVKVAYGNDQPLEQQTPATATAQAAIPATEEIDTRAVIAPIEGKFFRTKSSAETAKKVGDQINEGEVIGYVESMKVYNAITSEVSGKILEICPADGDTVDEDDVLIKLQ